MTLQSPVKHTAINIQSPAIRALLIVLISIGGVTTAIFFSLPAPETPPDFMNLYVGASLAGTRDLYNEQAGWALQDKLVGQHSEGIPFLRPPFYAALLKPLLLFTYKDALQFWHSLLVLFLLAFVWIFPADRVISLSVICWSEAVAANFVLGQDTLLLLVPIALCILLYRRGQPYPAGLVLSLCLIKFHFLLFVPLLILLQKLWRFGLGIATGTLGLVLMSFAVQGLYWPADYVRALLRPTSNPGKESMINLRALALSAPHAFWIVIFMTIVVAILAGAVCKRASFDLALPCCFLAGLMVNLHVYSQDYALVIPLLCLLVSRIRGAVIFVVLFSGVLYFSTFWTIVIGLFLLAFTVIEGPSMRSTVEEPARAVPA